VEQAWAKVQEFVTEYGFSLVGAILIFFIGRWLAKVIKGWVTKAMSKGKTDPMLINFVSNLVYVGLLTFVIIAALARVGVQTGSFIAVVGAAGLAVGLALQGALANFAAGVLLLIFRPFKTGDLIEGAGTLGVVKEISIFTTVLNTPDNKRVIVPNGKLMGDNITNYSAEDTRRVDLVIGVSYSADLKKTAEVIMDVLKTDELVLDDPAPNVAVLELADSSVNFVVRPWTKTDTYWDVYFGTTQKVKERLDAEGIEIPFPQRDVHMIQSS
jgi:small conductance mechanosensitive channel